MNDFDREFEKASEDIARARKLAVWWSIFYGLLALTVLSGTAYVVYKVLAHYGIL
ncbi:MAG: hypothetical protein M0R06_01365 [Sphaerochaeta sp.]|jgi:hypothetical protein|nr:hypothetical protein [Sphaerochaeta sp.]